MEIEKIRKELKKDLKKERYMHTIGVMHTAAALAMCYGESLKDALLAGLLHDCGKLKTEEEQLKRCKKYGIRLSDAEKEIPALIHAKLGAYLAKEKYEVDNQDILSAILYHTTGHPDMTMLEKIVYLADYIEPGRKIIPGLEEIRKLAFTDIDQAVCQCSKNTLQYLKKQGRSIDPMTAQTYDYYNKK